jgi:hypothetical protein
MATSFAATSGTAANINDQSFSFLSGGSSTDQAQKEDDAYSEAQDALNESDYSRAAQLFDTVAKMKGRRADAAIYWRAYALNKQSRRNEALSAISELRSAYPKSNYLREAGALEIEIRKQSGTPVNPTAEGDDEMKLIALQALMDSNEDRALPILKKILEGNASQKVKDKAMFVLSQNDSAGAQQLLGDIALGKQLPTLQEKAIHYLGISGHGGAQLQRIYDASSDEKLKKSVLHAFMVSGDQDRVFTLAQKEPSNEMKKEAIHMLGVMGAGKQLRELYKTVTTADLKKEIMHSMGISGDSDDLIEIAKTETDPDVRAAAIHGIGIGGGGRSSDALVQMYNANTDKTTKTNIIHALFIQGAGKQMVALARKETDPQMKKEIVSKISVMGSKEGNDYLLEILNQ